MTSSLKTFLKGENPIFNTVLRDALPLHHAAEGLCAFDAAFSLPRGFWQIDVLDDGTAITYCAVSYKL